MSRGPVSPTRTTHPVSPVPAPLYHLRAPSVAAGSPHAGGRVAAPWHDVRDAVVGGASGTRALAPETPDGSSLSVTRTTHPVSPVPAPLYHLRAPLVAAVSVYSVPTGADTADTG